MSSPKIKLSPQSSKSASGIHNVGQPHAASTVQSPEPRRVELVAIGDLKPWPGNVRTHLDRQIEKLMKSICYVGFQNPVMIDEANTILVGHARVEAARRLGHETVPCLRITNLSIAQKRTYVLADNRLALDAGWDRKALSIELEELSELILETHLEFDLSVTGFDQGELDALQIDFATMESEEPDELPELSPTPVTCAGDLWLAGEHRILCADARDKHAYAVLMNGRRAQMVITDPPWNVRVNGHVSGRGQVRHSEFAFASGEMSSDEFRDFLLATIGGMSAISADGALIYVFSDWRHVGVMAAVGDALALELRNICVWNKTTPGQGSFYRSAHELVFIFQKPGGPRINNIQQGRFGRSRTNVWTFASPNKFAGKTDDIREHPTPKPTQMIAEAIKDASNRNGIVLDAFLGSGTTILAAEKVGRIAYAIEVEPGFVDLAIRRWQNLTRKDVRLASTGQTFDDVGRGRLGSLEKKNAAKVGVTVTRPRTSRRRRAS